MKLLLVDDDPDLLDLLAHGLGRQGYAVRTATDGASALALCRAERPGLVVLDVILPNGDGVEVCRQIHQESHTPVILLTGRRDEADVVRGLDAGADNFLTKPVSLSVLTACMAAVLRRYRQQQGDGQRPVVVREGDLVLDPETHGVTKGGQPALLTPTEFRVLYVLASNAGHVLPMAGLAASVWGSPDTSRAAALRVHLAAIRRKLGLPAQGPGSLQRVRGTGYTLTRRSPSGASAAPGASTSVG
jgi:DNA-binding response OmpR family regulator